MSQFHLSKQNVLMSSQVLLEFEILKRDSRERNGNGSSTSLVVVILTRHLGNFQIDSSKIESFTTVDTSWFSMGATSSIKIRFVHKIEKWYWQVKKKKKETNDVCGRVEIYFALCSLRLRLYHDLHLTSIHVLDLKDISVSFVQSVHRHFLHKLKVVL